MLSWIKKTSYLSIIILIFTNSCGILIQQVGRWRRLAKSWPVMNAHTNEYIQKKALDIKYQDGARVSSII